jgi:hypothetical protein
MSGVSSCAPFGRTMQPKPRELSYYSYDEMSFEWTNNESESDNEVSLFHIDTAIKEIYLYCTNLIIKTYISLKKRAHSSFLNLSLPN